MSIDHRKPWLQCGATVVVIKHACDHCLCHCCRQGLIYHPKHRHHCVICRRSNHFEITSSFQLMSWNLLILWSSWLLKVFPTARIPTLRGPAKHKCTSVGDFPSGKQIGEILWTRDLVQVPKMMSVAYLHQRCHEKQLRRATASSTRSLFFITYLFIFYLISTWFREFMCSGSASQVQGVTFAECLPFLPTSEGTVCVRDAVCPLNLGVGKRSNEDEFNPPFKHYSPSSQAFSVIQNIQRWELNHDQLLYVV